MQKFVKIKLRDKSSITLPYEQAEQVMSSPEQIVMLYDENEQWTGQSLNKADIIFTERNYEEEKQYQREKITTLPEPEKDLEKVSELLKKYKPDFLKEDE